jgi:phosphotransferase system enzyme I (PtsI)
VEANPFLGWRSIRVCLDHPEVFRPQLRALLRAAVHQNLRAMLPLVTRVDEIRRTRAILEEEARLLASAGIPAAATLPLGVMMETPAAAVIADRLAQECDFFSVGTNDLTQYTLAVDRGNARLASRFTPQDPAVLRLLKQVMDAAQAHGIECGVCGEMASEPLTAVLLIGLDYTSLSIAPPSLRLMKWLIRRIPYSACRAAAHEALHADGPAEVDAILKHHVSPHVDLHLVDPHGPLPARGART